MERQQQGLNAGIIVLFGAVASLLHQVGDTVGELFDFDLFVRCHEVFQGMSGCLRSQFQ